MRSPIPWSFALALVAGTLSGCDSCDAPETPARPGRVDPPPGLTWEGSIGGGRQTLSALRALAPGRLSEVVPPTPGAVLERLTPELALAEIVPEDTAIRALSLRVASLEPVVAAARIAAPEGDTLGPELALVDGAPHGGRWVGAAPGAGAPAAMVLGDALIVTDHPAALERAAPYLAYAVEADEPEEGVSVRIPAGVVSGDLRARADAALERWSHEAHEAIAEERARHETPPAFGDPDELVRAVRELLGSYAAYMPDVGDVRLSARATPAGLVIDADADVRADTPLAAAIAGARAIDPEVLLSLPGTTALAWAASPADDEAPSFVRRALERIGGERLGGEGRAKLAAADAALSEASVYVVALGAGEASPWALLASRPAIDVEALRGALDAPFVEELAGALLRCEGPIVEPAWRDGDGTRQTVLCRGALAPQMSASTGSPGASALAIARAEPVAAATAARMASGHAPDSLADDADAARIVGELGDEAVVAGVLVPSRLLPAAGLFAFGPDQDATRSRPAPLGWSLVRTEGGLRARAVATGAALEDLAGLAALF